MVRYAPLPPDDILSGWPSPAPRCAEELCSDGTGRIIMFHALYSRQTVIAPGLSYARSRHIAAEEARHTPGKRRDDEGMWSPYIALMGHFNVIRAIHLDLVNIAGYLPEIINRQFWRLLENI